MKKAKGDETIKAIPDSSYEAGTISHEISKNKNNRLNKKSTDGQGNGYPTNKSSNKKGE